MTYDEMMAIGKQCGITDVGACYDNIERHYDTFFKIEEANSELLKLQKDICKNNPTEFMKIFSVSEKLVKKWNSEE